MSNDQMLSDAELDPQAAGCGVTNTVSGEDLSAVSRRPKDLVTRADIDRLSQRCDVIGLAYLVGHCSLIGFGGWLVWSHLSDVWLLPALALQSIFLGFLFSPLHECAHATAFRTRWLNESALWLVAIVYVVPPYFFRYFHLGHHRFTQVPGKDPSLVLPEPASFKQYLWYCAGLWFWWRNLSWIAKHALGVVDPNSANYVPKQRIAMMVTEARVMVAVYATIAAAAVSAGLAIELTVCWLLPRFFGEPLQRIIRVAEHVGCEESHNLLKNTRTTLSNALVNAIAWQMPYHAEHHLFPNVPFHALPALHKLVASDVIIEPRGYIAGQIDIIAKLRSRRGIATGATSDTKSLL